MKVAFVDQYALGEGILHKDPITIPLALSAIGCEVKLINGSLQKAKSNITGLEVLEESNSDLLFWKRNKFDAVVFFSRFDNRYDAAIQAAKASGARVLIKGDTDGTLGYPLIPNYLRTRPISANLFGNLLRNIKWRAPIKKIVGKKLRQIKDADVVIVESPGAAVNIIQILNYWDMASHAVKVHFIPNPVASIQFPVTKNKNKTIIGAGRWDDDLVKNTKETLTGIVSFLHNRSDYSCELYGTGLDSIPKSDSIDTLIESGRLRLSGWISHNDLQMTIKNSRTVVICSKLESYGLIAAEALIIGSSIVVTPIESLIFLAGGGTFGTVARGFEGEDVAAALDREALCWDQGLRKPQNISEYWSSILNPETIAKQYLNLFIELENNIGN